MTEREFLTHFVGRLLDGIVEGIEDLSAEELHFRPHEDGNSIAFDAWHVMRTADNVIYFAFDREQPVWAQQGLAERWALPRTAQGTGTDPDEAHALQFPEADALAQYGRDVRRAVVERIEGMSDEYLDAVTEVRPWGEIPRKQAIGQTIIAHGNNHLGQIAIARMLVGKPGAGF